jgi:hypothetical protein
MWLRRAAVCDVRIHTVSAAPAGRQRTDGLRGMARPPAPAAPMIAMGSGGRVCVHRCLIHTHPWPTPPRAQQAAERELDIGEMRAC